MEITVKGKGYVEHILSRDIYNKERVIEGAGAIVYKILSYIHYPRTYCEILNVPYWNIMDKLIMINSGEVIQGEVDTLRNNLIKMGINVDGLRGYVDENEVFIMEFDIENKTITFNTQGILDY